MQLPLIVTTIIALVVAETAPATPVAELPVRCLLAAWGTAIVPVIAWLIVRAAVTLLRDPQYCPQTVLQRFSGLQRAHTGLWIFSTAFVFWFLGWPQIVRHNWGLGDAILIDEVLILLPLIGGMGLSWAAFHRLDMAASGRASLVADLKSGWMEVRLQFGAVLAPILVVTLLDDLCRKFAPPPLDSGIESPVIAIPLVAAALFAFPMLMRWVWPTARMEGHQAGELVAAADRLGVAVPRIYVWMTGPRFANAAVAGCFRRARYVLLSEGLLRNFPAADVEAVFLHELGHVRGRHLEIRGLALGVLVAWLGAIYLLCDRFLACFSFDVGIFGSASTVVGTVAAIGYGWLVFGPLARLLEHDADLYAAAARNRCGETNAVALIRTLDRLGRSHAARKASWLYPGIDSRIALLESSLRSSATAQSVRRRVHRATRSLWIGLLAAGFFALAFIQT